MAEKIPDRIFSKEETKYINSKKNKAQTAAGIYAAKEAVLKAVGCGITLPLNEVCVFHYENGAPYLSFGEKVNEYLKNRGLIHWEISISHDGEYAMASAWCHGGSHETDCLAPLLKFKDAPQNAITPDVAKGLLTKRNSQTHKGDYGRLYVLAGSKGLTGAAIMACTAALKCGAGLISLGCAQELNSIFETSMWEVMTKPLKSKNGFISKENKDTVLGAIQSANLALIGPGLGRNGEITELVKSIVSSENQTPLVIDADGLYAISQDTSVLCGHKMPIILTPHIGEFSFLTGLSPEEILSDTEKHASLFAKKYNVVLVLKSHRTVVATPEGNTFVNVLGNPGMATGGTGDVLSGTVASFAAQGIALENAALLGVYIHSYGADLAAIKTGEYSLTPSDIIDYIPHAIKATIN